MHLIHSSQTVYFQFGLLAGLPGIWHGIFVRYAFDDTTHRVPFNLGLHGIEPDETVWCNRQRTMRAAGLSFAVFARQVHGVEVGVWTDNPTHDQYKKGGHIQLAGDALVTHLAGAALFIQTADCQSVVLADPVQRVVANIHSGWRGSIGNIVGRTVDIMQQRFNCHPQNIHCGIGPSLGPCCAEFIHYRQEIPEFYWGYRHNGDYFDFWRMTADQLTAKGVLREHIELSNICTRCNPHLFYSYRGEKEQAGRFAAAIALVDGKH